MKTKQIIAILICVALMFGCSEQSNDVATVVDIAPDQLTGDPATDLINEMEAVSDDLIKNSGLAAGDVEEVPAASSAPQELKPEKTGIVETLPEQYPAEWILIQDAAFFHMLDGRLLVVDASSDDSARRYKGMFNSSIIGQFAQSTTRPELYSADTYLSRGTRGDRTDVLTIYDKRTLAPIDEVILPAKRSSNMPTIFNLQLADNEKLALIYNFTPAASISIVDLDTRTMLGEVPIPGCALAYPMAGRGFSTVCGDGTIQSVKIGANADDVESNRTEAFFDYENDPLMEKAVQIGNTTYFPTFKGNIQPVDMSGDIAVPGEAWSMLGEGDEGWLPGGLQSTGVDDAGRMYVLMHPDGYDGSHKDPGVEVWVYDVGSKQRVDRIKLELPAISMGITRGEKPLMVTTNINLTIDVYDVTTGSYQRTIDDIGAQTPFMLHGAR